MPSFSSSMHVWLVIYFDVLGSIVCRGSQVVIVQTLVMDANPIV